MTPSLTALIRSLVIPVALLTAVFFSLPALQQLPARSQFLLQYLPYAIAAVALVIAVLLNQARTTGLSLLLAIAYGVLTLINQATEPGQWAFIALFCSYSILLPLNLVLFSSVRERGLFNQYGFALLGLIPLQLALVGWLIQQQPVDPFSVLAQSFLPAVAGLGAPVPDAGIVALLLAVLVMGWHFLRQPSTLNASLLVFPLVLGAVGYSHDEPALPQALLSAIGFTFILGLVLDMHRVAYRDELSGLPNRRALNLYLAAPGRRYTIAMLDVDHFKKFNDTYGHDVGDEVLRMVASQLQRVGGGGRVFRYGGEEFTIVFRGRDIADARPHLETIRERIADYSLAVRSKNRPKNAGAGKKQRGSKQNTTTTNVTISMGLASRSADHRHPEAVLKAADTALYRAKKAGRNRIAT